MTGTPPPRPKTFEERLRDDPIYDDMDCRPGPANLSAEYSDSITPDYIKAALAAKRKPKVAEWRAAAAIRFIWSFLTR